MSTSLGTTTRFVRRQVLSIEKTAPPQRGRFWVGCGTPPFADGLRADDLAGEHPSGCGYNSAGSRAKRCDWVVALLRALRAEACGCRQPRAEFVGPIMRWRRRRCSAYPGGMSRMA